MIKKVLFALVLAILVAILLFQFAFVEIPIAARFLPAGHLISSEDIVVERVFFTNVPEVLDTNLSSIIGRTTSMDVAEGSLMMPFLLAPLSGNNNPIRVEIDRDSALVPLVVSESNVPSTISNGQTVQMIAYFGIGEASMKPAFTHSFPYTALVHAVRSNELGEIIGVDIITNRSIAHELALASIQGRVVLVVVHEDTNPIPSGTDVDQLHNMYFRVDPAPMPAPTLD